MHEDWISAKEVQADRFVENGRIVNITAAAVTIDPKLHANKTITLNRAAGIVATLPAALGTGDRYKFVVGTSVTSNADIIKVANAADVMCGVATLFQDGGDAMVGFAAGATADTVNMDGSTQGGLKGALVEVEDIATNLWHVRMIGDASGTEATPFAATVA